MQVQDKTETTNVDIQRFQNGFWYVIDRTMNMTVAIRQTLSEAEEKCRCEGWTVEHVKLAA